MKGKQIKSVLIDNDKDDAFDERIVFSYLATNSNADFTLVTNNDKVVVAIDDGDNLKILESESKLSKMEANKTAFVFTDQQGKEVEFFIESYDSLKQNNTLIVRKRTINSVLFLFSSVYDVK